MNQTLTLKKVLLVIAISVLLLIELFMVFMITWGVLVRGESNIMEFIFVMGLFGFPLWMAVGALGTTQPKSAVSKGASNPTYDFNNTGTALKLETRIELPHYRKLVYRLTYTHPVVLFLHFIGAMMIWAYFMNPQNNWFLYFIVFFILLFPLIIYRSANSNYKATKTLHEPLTYAFGQESFTITGETFNTTLQWKSLYKIRELGDWFLLYTNKLIAMPVPKSAFASLNDIERFRKLAAEARA